ANRALPENLGYDISVVATRAGSQQTSGCIAIQAQESISQVDLSGVDLLVVPGGNPGTQQAMKDRALLDLIRRAHDRGITIASICTGAFVLAASGILEGRSCTTHWSGIDLFRSRFPEVRVQKDVIYHCEDNIWTSAGVSTGIDMSIALVTQDYGSLIANHAARNLVLFAARPPKQKQISDLLSISASPRQKLQELVLYINTQPNSDHSVSSMAERCHMSPRNFTRKFKEEFDMPPAAMVRKIRLARARYLLEHTNHNVKCVAKLSGFSSVNVMRQCLNVVHTSSDGQMQDALHD
ncbi:MAG: DJ-1/PfpI family protein, partial [Pseudoruegeria sp.]